MTRSGVQAKQPLELLLRQWMESTVAAKRLDSDAQRFLQRHGSRFSCADDLLLNLGKVWTRKPVPTGIRIGRRNRCYDNALALAMQDPDRFTYVEGYALHEDLIWPVWHAWVLDEDGLIFDNTPGWRDSTVYWGLAMPMHVVTAACVKNGTTGIFEGDWHGDFHFIREGWRDCV